MITFDLSTHIFRPLHQVFAFVAAPENDFLWQYGVLASDRISIGSLQPGSTFRTVGHFMGRRIESVYQVTEIIPSISYAFKTLSGPVDSQTQYTFHTSLTSTLLTISTHTDQKDLFKASDSIVEKKLKRQCKENLAILKSLMESRQLVRA